MSPLDNRCELKIVVSGSSDAGKSSIIHRYTNNDFSPKYTATIGVGFATKQIFLPDYGTVTLNIWDTAGQERFEALTPMYYRNADGALVVYDLNHSDGLETARKWKTKIDEQFQSPLPVMLLANKCDLVKDKTIPEDVVRQSQFCGSAVTSAKDNIGIDEAIQQLVIKI